MILFATENFANTFSSFSYKRLVINISLAGQKCDLGINCSSEKVICNLVYENKIFAQFKVFREFFYIRLSKCITLNPLRRRRSNSCQQNFVYINVKHSCSYFEGFVMCQLKPAVCKKADT